jgi:membrane protein DedA with SNARE-associated domain
MSILVLLALATLVSEDLTCITAGALVASGRLALFPATAACFAGILTGDLLLYVSGRIVGPRLLQLHLIQR